MGATPVVGGIGGYSPCYNGFDGRSLDATGGLVRHSGVQFNPSPIVTSGTVIETPVQDPVLRLVGTVTPGATVELVLRGMPGENAGIFLGRAPLVLERPGSAIERLTTDGRLIDVSPLPSTGEARVPITIPANWPTGTIFYLQGVASDGPGQVQYSNSVPLVVL